MKKLSGLLQTISACFVNKNEEEHQEQNLQRKEPLMNGNPGCTHQEPGSRSVANEPADAARKLWCRAQHF